jgi:hypothetical protein
MSTDQVKATVHRHRPAAIVGGLVGLTFLVAFVVYEFVLTPAAPDLQKSPPTDVVAYIANPRGLGRLPQIEQQRFLERWRDLIMQDARKKDELKVCFENMDDDLRQNFSAEIFKHFKRFFLDDAKAYARLSQDDRNVFLRDRAVEYRNRALFVKDVARGFGKQFKGTEDDLRGWIMEHTTAEERAVGEPYVEALKRAEEQVHKEKRRAPAGAPSTAPSSAGSDNSPPG